MKHIEVVAAIINQEGTYFATQRGYGEYEGMWEFPGGKIEPGESEEEALQREIHEELGIDVIVDKLLCTTDYNYPTFHITLHFYFCHIKAGEIELREHKAAQWLAPETLNSVEWLPADEEVLQYLVRIK